jgi:hypothetical protein
MTAVNVLFIISTLHVFSHAYSILPDSVYLAGFLMKLLVARKAIKTGFQIQGENVKVLFGRIWVNHDCVLLMKQVMLRALLWNKVQKLVEVILYILLIPYIMVLYMYEKYFAL